MASIVLGVAGSFLGGPVGGAVGALVGGYLDQRYILPGLFPAQPVVGPRIAELKIQGTDEGHPVNWVIGGKYRLAGEVRWASIIREIKIEDDGGGGGKGGGGGNTGTIVGYEYRCDVAVAISSGPITGVKQVLGEGRLLYDSNPDIAYTSPLFSAAVSGSGSRLRMRVNSTGPDLAKLRPGYNAVISGFANAGNNGTFKCKASGSDAGAGTSYAYFANTGVVNETAGATVSISQSGLPNFDAAEIDSVAVYLGSSAQTADPTIEAQEGVGQVPGFRDSAYVVLKNLRLDSFGRRLPQFGFIVEDTAHGTYPLAVGGILAKSGRSSSEWDVTRLTGSMDGYAVTGPQAPAQVVQPLLISGDILAQDRSGVMTFFHRKNAPVVEVDASYLAAHEWESDTPRPLRIQDSADSPLPSEVDVRYVDLEASEQSGGQNARRRVFSVDGIVPVDLPIAMSAGKAHGIALRMLYSAWVNRRTVTLQLPPRFMFLLENDCLRLKAIGVPWLLLVTKIDEGANGLIIVDCIVENRDVLTQPEVASAPYTASVPASGSLYDTSPNLSELPPITPTATGYGHHVPVIQTSAALEDVDDPWRGVRVFWSDDDGEFVPVAEITQEATSGGAITALSGTGILAGVWDNVSTVDVELDNGSLASEADIEVLNGANRALLGSEVIAFRTATLIGTRQYRLSGLLRGLRDTFDAMTGHAAGEPFVLLNSAVVEKPISLGSLNTTRYVRWVPGGGLVASAPSTVVTISGKSLRPFSPGGIFATRDAVGSLAATWTRRTRAVTRLFSAALPPLHEASERYEVDVVWPAGGGTIKRTIAATSPTATYTDAQQASDGVTGFTPIELRIYQLSEIYGRGKALILTV